MLPNTLKKEVQVTNAKVNLLNDREQSPIFLAALVNHSEAVIGLLAAGDVIIIVIVIVIVTVIVIVIVIAISSCAGRNGSGACYANCF